LVFRLVYIFWKSHGKITSSLGGGCGLGSDQALAVDEQSDGAGESSEFWGGSEEF
jgi:hypothetical protein